MTTTAFTSAYRINASLTASTEKRALLWMAQRLPAWVTSDGLTALGFAAQLAAGAAWAAARHHPRALILVTLFIALNWFGDSMDGTLARVRNQQRPRYGFYVDHMLDILGTTALLLGLGVSGYAHWPIAIAMLLGFLLLSGESFLATYTLGRFEMSQGIFGPTELRLLLIAGILAILRSPFSTVFGHRFLLFDLGGTIGSIAMALLVLYLTARHTAQLFQAEPIQAAEHRA